MTVDISAHIERNREYVRIVEGSEYAVLFVHGIVGTPRHFDFLIDVVPPNVSIYNMLLDGHGYGVRDFSRTFVYRSYADEVVSRKTFKMIEDIPCAELHILKHSTHFYYPDGDPDILRAELARVLGIALGETEKTHSASETQSNG